MELTLENIFQIIFVRLKRLLYTIFFSKDAFTTGSFSQNARYKIRRSISRPQNDIGRFQDIETLRCSLRLLNDRYRRLRDRSSIPTNARRCRCLLGLSGRDSWLPLLHVIESFLDGSQSLFQTSSAQNAYL